MHGMYRLVMDESQRDPAKELSDLMKETSVTGTCDAEVNKADLHNAEKEQDDMFHCKLFVGNIGYRQTWKDLKDFFGKFGKVVYAQIVFDHLKRRSRGIGFVEFSTTEDADRCLMAPPEELILEGRTLRVNYAIESKKSTFKMYPQVPDLMNADVMDADVTDTNDPDQITKEQIWEDKSHILSTDEWRIIFSFLTVPEQIRLERVCRRWRDTALQIWKDRRELTCKGFSFRMLLTDKVLTSVLNRCSGSLRSLDLCSAAQVLSEYSLTIIGHHCAGLVRLDMSGVQATNVGLRDLSDQAKQLEWVKLQKCQHIAEKGLWWLFKNCDQLQHIDFADNHAITGKCFFMLKPNLRCMIANNCRKLTDYGILELSKKCPDLRDLQIHSCVSLTDTAIRALTTLSDLEVLDVGGSFPKASTGPWSSIGNLHKLRELRLDLNTHITDEAVGAIAKGCPNLRALNLSGCRPHVTEVGLSSLTVLDHLVSLDISYIKQVTDCVLEKLASRGLLERLVIHTCLEVTEAGVQHVLELCCRLTVLDLSNNTQLTRSALACLTNGQCDRPADLPLEIVIGGTTMMLEEEEEGAAPLDLHLPSWVSLQRHNRANRQFNPVNMLYLPEPWSDEEEGDDLQEVAAMLVEGDILREGGAEKGGNLPERADALLERGERVKDEGPPLFEVLGEELWEGEPVVVQPRVHQPAVQQRPGLFVDIDDDLGDFDEDYDEFLENDDALEMERWQLS